MDTLLFEQADVRGRSRVPTLIGSDCQGAVWYTVLRSMHVTHCRSVHSLLAGARIMAFLRPALLALVVAMCCSAVYAHGGDDDYHYKHKKYHSGLKRITEALLRREEIVPDVIR